MISTPKEKRVLYLSSALCDGLEDKNYDHIKMLLESKKADPNILLPSSGITPFHLIIGNESEMFAEKVTKLFLRHGGNPNVKSQDGMTPVHVAAAWGRMKILELLLANGGDPLDADEEGRTPFHYAFDGSYYDAIAILGKFSSKDPEIDEDDDDDDDQDKEHKIEMKLEKILVNHGDIIAEYVPAEIDLATDTQCETQENIASISRIPCSSEDNLKHEWLPNLKNFKPSCNPDDNVPNLNVQNVTFRRGSKFNLKKKGIASTFQTDNLNDEKKNDIEEILNRLIKNQSNSNIKKNMVKIDNAINIGSSKSRSKYFVNNLKSDEDKFKSDLLETSIISKSPNFKLPIKKVPRNLKFPAMPKQSSPKGSSSPVNDDSYTLAEKPIELELKKASKDKKTNEKLKYLPTNTTYNCGDYSNLSLNAKDTENHHLKSRKFDERIVKKLEGNMYGEECGNIPTKNHNMNEQYNSPIRLKYRELFSNVNTKNIFRISKNKSINLPTQPEGKHPINIPVKLEPTIGPLESPKSAHPFSSPHQYQSARKESEMDEEMKIWEELDEIYRAKGQTPLASISGYINDSTKSSNASKSSSSTAADTTFDAENVSDESKYSELIAKTHYESFLSVDEEYAYVDAEKDVAFMERRLRVLSKMDGINEAMLETSLTSNQTSPRTSGEFDRLYKKGGFVISNCSLRHQLIACGESPGPITDTTHYIYLKRFYKLRRKQSTNLIECKNESISQNYEVANNLKISEKMLSTDWMTNLESYRKLEELAFREYERPNDNKKYRGGMAKSSFNYLLLDPRITKDLPRNGRNLTLTQRWQVFLGAIFYVGKGKSSRPFAHLYESHEIWTGKRLNDESNEKIQRILDIWREGKGVVCQQVFIYSMQEEAFTREAAMIDALGIKHLSNCNRGKYYGLAATMSNDERISLGKYLLYKAMEILMHDGERQQFPRNIE